MSGHFGLDHLELRNIQVVSDMVISSSCHFGSSFLGLTLRLFEFGLFRVTIV